MTIITVAGIIAHADRFEGMLSEYYRGISEQSTREGVRLLTDYMSRHRRRINQTLDRLDPEEMRRVLCVVLPFDPEVADCRCFEGRQLDPDAPASEVLDAATELDHCLIRLYHQAAREADDPVVKEFFESLVRAEERDARRLQRIKAMDYF